MEFITIDGDPKPKVMYTPYIYSTITPISIGYIIEDPKGYKVTYTPDKKRKPRGYEKEGDVLVRDPNRIQPFMEELGKIWKDNVPDWRFSQLIENVFGEMDYVPWMLEEHRMLEEFHKYFEEKHESGRIKGPQTRKPGRRKRNG